MTPERAAQPIDSGNPSEIAIQIFDNGKLMDTIRAPLPQGFPPEFGHHLADFMAQGFNLAYSRQPTPLPDLTDFAGSLRGRPIEDEVGREGQEASKLHRQNPKLSWQKIALQVCRMRTQTGHYCKRKCANRVRQAAKSYEIKEEENRIARGEG